ncbi:MAG: hypothetical protein QOF89_6074 [Acidobacteriota bacterium]|nr:hypothetical protein [Acidobacteriota bacterium]
MASLLDLVHQQLDPQAISQLSRQLGTDEATTQQAVPAALTALLGGLAQGSSQPEGAQQLAGALDQHDGSLLDNLSGFFQNKALGAQGGGILSHIFGHRQPAAESQISQATGLDKGQAARLLMLLAPIVLAALGRAKRQRNLDPGGLASVLAGERQHIEQTQPQHGGLLNILLDRNGDGHIADDLAGMAGGLLGRNR